MNTASPQSTIIWGD